MLTVQIFDVYVTHIPSLSPSLSVCVWHHIVNSVRCSVVKVSARIMTLFTIWCHTHTEREGEREGM